MILVTGATGKVGSEALRSLARRGVKARALVRDPGRAKGLGLEAELAAGDLERPETLGAAMKGVDALILVAPPEPNLAEMEANAIAAARAQGVGRIVLLSALGAGRDAGHRFARWHSGGEEAVRRSGPGFTVLRPNYFMQNLLGYARSIAEQGTIFAPAKEGRLAMVDSRDVGEAAAAVAAASGKHDGKTYDLNGPEAISFRELAMRLGQALGRQVLFVDVPRSQTREQLLTAGVPAEVAEGVIELHTWYAEGHGADTGGELTTLLGRAPRRLEDFARDHAGEFARA